MKRTLGIFVKLRTVIGYCPMLPNRNVNSALSCFFLYRYIWCRMYIAQNDFKIQNSILSRIVDLSVEADFMSQNDS